MNNIFALNGTKQTGLGGQIPLTLEDRSLPQAAELVKIKKKIQQKEEPAQKLRQVEVDSEFKQDLNTHKEVKKRELHIKMIKVQYLLITVIINVDNMNSYPGYAYNY